MTSVYKTKYEEEYRAMFPGKPFVRKADRRLELSRKAEIASRALAVHEEEKRRIQALKDQAARLGLIPGIDPKTTDKSKANSVPIRKSLLFSL